MSDVKFLRRANPSRAARAGKWVQKQLKKLGLGKRMENHVERQKQLFEWGFEGLPEEFDVDDNAGWFKQWRQRRRRKKVIKEMKTIFILRDPYLQEPSLETFLEVADRYPVTNGVAVVCGICGDFIVRRETIAGYKFEPGRDHPLYYICTDCAREGGIEGIWMRNKKKKNAHMKVNLK